MHGSQSVAIMSWAGEEQIVSRTHRRTSSDRRATQTTTATTTTVCSLPLDLNSRNSLTPAHALVSLVAEWQEYAPPPFDDAGAPPPSESLAAQRVYVGNLSWGVTWQMLKDHMRSAGVVLHVDILQAGGRSKGCGVVTFAAVSDADAAVVQLNNSVLDGRTIFVRHDREDRRARPSTGCRVYVGNLAWNVKWQDLKDHMKQAGRVVYADGATQLS